MKGIGVVAVTQNVKKKANDIKFIFPMSIFVEIFTHNFSEIHH